MKPQRRLSPVQPLQQGGGKRTVDQGVTVTGLRMNRRLWSLKMLEAMFRYSSQCKTYLLSMH